MMLIRQLILFFVIQIVASLTNWPFPNEDTQVVFRTQRDVSTYIPIDKINSYGVSLSSVVFDKEGYISSSTSYINSLLNDGVGSLVIDLYWNNFTSKWQLCPAPYAINQTDITTSQSINWNGQSYECQPDFTTDQIFQVIDRFFSNTNNNMNVNYLKLLYRLNKFKFPKSSVNSTTDVNHIYYSKTSPYNNLGNSTLSDTLATFGSLLYTPENLNNFQTELSTTNDQSFYNHSINPFPSFETFIYTNLKRVISMVIYDEVSIDSYNFTDSDKQTIFINGTSLNMTLESIDSPVVNECLGNIFNLSSIGSTQLFDNLSLTTQFSYVADNNDINFNDASYKSVVRCGFSPILNSSTYNINSSDTDFVGDIVDHFLPLSFWSWNSNLTSMVDTDNSDNSDDSDDAMDDTSDNSSQDSSTWSSTIMSAASSYPSTISSPTGSAVQLNALPSNLSTVAAIINGKDTMTNDNSEQNNQQKAYKCVSIMNEGWTLENCYRALPYACQHTTEPNKWIITTDKKQYFDASKASNCPDNYFFSVPKSSVEMMALMYEISKSDASYPIWIDLNDITVTNCFVEGGPYAGCPYQTTISTKGLAAKLAPAFVTIVVVVILILLEKILRTNPIQTNKKRYWRRAVDDYNKKYYYEGVPS